MRHCGCVGASVSATAPDSSSSEPPLEFSTRAVPVSVKTACSPPRSPTSLKSSRVTVAAGGFIVACAAAMRTNRQRNETMCFMLFIDHLYGYTGAGRHCDDLLRGVLPVGTGWIGPASI